MIERYPGKAAVVRQSGGPFVIEDVSIAAPDAEEVLVRVVATGMCHTDMVARDQDYPVPLPVVLGHEGAGIVERVGSAVTTVVPGDHVVMTYASCGKCDICEGGRPFLCRNFYPMNFGGSRLDGKMAIEGPGGPLHDHFFGQSSFASYAIAAERNVVKVRRDVPLELLGPLGCGIQTGAGAVLNTFGAVTGRAIGVFGSGAVGLSAVMAAHAAGATIIIAVDTKPNRLALARELGATHTINGTQEDTVDAIQRITQGKGLDFALEATANPRVLKQAIASLGIGGTCGIVGAPAMGVEGCFDWNGLMVPGQTIKGIIEGESVPHDFIPRLIDMHVQGRFPFDKLIKFYGLDHINEAAADSERGVTLKPIIRLSSGA